MTIISQGITSTLLILTSRFLIPYEIRVAVSPIAPRKLAITQSVSVIFPIPVPTADFHLPRLLIKLTPRPVCCIDVGLSPDRVVLPSR